jgi:biotin---protein ligase
MLNFRMKIMSGILQPISSDYQVLIFKDKGVNKHSVKALKSQLQEILDRSISIQKVDGAYLRTQPWENKTIALFMGGGVCKEWDACLGEEGIQKIRNFVDNGHLYVGLCAGAYFASRRSLFHLNGQPPIEKQRPLALFSGKAIGPVIPTDNYLSVDAAQAAEVSFVINDKKQKGYLYYQGGCFFEPDQSSSDTQIVAQYESLSPNRIAAVKCKFGKGSVFLCGLHPEFRWTKEQINTDNDTFSKLAETLSAQEDFRKQVWTEIAKTLTLSKI